MATEIDICNKALAYFGIDPISSFNDPSKAARTCKVVYPLARDAALGDHEWGFATVEKDLALLDETVSEYSFAYRYPVDCMRAIRIPKGVSAATTIYDISTGQYVATKDIDFKVRASVTGNYNMIVTDQEEAKLIYVYQVTNPTLFSPKFTDALVWRVAADLAVAMMGNFNLQSSYMNLYTKSFSDAQSNSDSESNETPNNSSSFTAAR